MTREFTVKELKEFIASAKAGDKEAFAIVYEHFYTPIFRYFYGRINNRDLAEDLTQDVFLRGYQSLNAYTVGAKSPLAYFYTIARNRLIDHWRKNNTESLGESQLNNLVDEQARSDEPSLHQEKQKILQLGLSVLNPDQREIITLKYLNELSTREVAEIMGKSEEAIRQNIVRALRIMNKKLEKYEF